MKVKSVSVSRDGNCDDKDYILIGNGTRYQYACIILSNNGYGKCIKIKLDGRECSVGQLDVNGEQNLDIYFKGVEDGSDIVEFEMILSYQDIFGNAYLQRFNSILKSSSRNHVKEEHEWKKIYNTGILLGMIAVFFLSATRRDSSHETDNVKVALEIDRDLNSEEGTETFESDVSEIEVNELSARYGSYRATEFYPTLAFQRRYLDNFMMLQEADMLLGRIFDIKPERLITYDVGERSFVNYNMQRYVIENPQYIWISMEPDYSDAILSELRSSVGKEHFDQLEGSIIVPLTDVPNISNGKHYFYAAADKDKLMMYSSVMTGGWFLLERCEEEPDDPLPEWSSQESLELLQGVYGKYQVTEFLTTKFFSALDGGGIAILPEEEASLMMGKTITMDEDLFVTYDNYRQPHSETAKRLQSDFWLDKIKIENSDYRAKNMRASEIYGIICSLRSCSRRSMWKLMFIRDM